MANDFAKNIIKFYQIKYYRVFWSLIANLIIDFIEKIAYLK